MGNMNKKRWIFAGICMMAALSVLLVLLNRDMPEEDVFLKLGESSGQPESAEKAASPGVSGRTDASVQPEYTDAKASSEDTDGETEIVIYICGAVKKPGVYQCRTGERVSHAVERAGGFKKNASELVNLAEPLTDGQRIYIPTKKEVLESPQETGDLADGQGSADVSGSGMQRSSMVNINTADAAVLMTLPGIGESRAKSILDYRKEHGSFQSIEEIKNISGIKEGLFSQIQELITVQ